MIGRRELLLGAGAAPVAGKANKMQAIYQLLRKLVLPSNATTGARIVIDGNSNAILIYNAANQLTEAISPVAGTDAAGNAYPSGYTAFNPAATPISFTNIKDGIMYQGFIPNAGTQPDFTHISFLEAASQTTAIYQSPWTAGNAPIQELYTAGTGSAFGSTAPSLQIQSGGAGNFPVDAVLLGALRGGDPVNGAYTWQTVNPTGGATPAFNTNWSSNSLFNGQSCPALRFRIDNENNLWVYGQFLAGAVVPGTTVFVLPVGFRPVAQAGGGNFFMDCMRLSGGVVTKGMLRADTSGNIVVANANGLGLAANDQFFVNGKVPLGELP